MVQHRIDQSNQNDAVEILIQYNTHIVNDDISSIKPCM